MRTIDSNEISFVAGAMIGGGSVGGIPLLEAGGSNSNSAIPEMVITASKPNNLVDVMFTAAVGRAVSGAGAALGEGIAMGLGAGAWLGPAGAVVGAVAGAGIAYLAFK